MGACAKRLRDLGALPSVPTAPRTRTDYAAWDAELVAAVVSLADTTEAARLPLALPARMAANRLAAARRGQVLAWMRAASH